MLDKLMKCRGSVSVFLVIVLVPTIVCASLFVDASRVKSARGLVSSAGELTINTVLSQYDVDLNDFYGLMASSQDMDDVINAAGDYFTSCIKSQGIDTTNASKYVNSIKGFFFGDDDISDLLGIGVDSESSVKVEPVKDGSLTNPALVKTQIVEFMKYRSPINSIVDLFQKFKDSSKELENTKKTTDLVDKKQEYYEAQGDVAEKAYEVYQNIEKFRDLGITNSDLQEIKNLLNELEDKYKDLHITMVKDLYNTQNVKTDGINRCVTIPPKYHLKKNNNSSAKTIGGQINKLMRAYDQFITKRGEFENNVTQWRDSGNVYYDIQYWAYCCKRSSYFRAVYNTETNMINSYKSLRDMVNNAADGALDELYTSTYKSKYLSVVKGTVKSIDEWYSYLKTNVENAVNSVTRKDTRYNTTVNKVLNCSNVYDRISTHSVNKDLSEIYNKLNDCVTRYKKGFDLLGKIVKGLSDLKKLVVTADKKFNTWESKANEYSASGISMATSDKDEIKKVKTDYKKLSTSDIESYSNHINNVKSALGTVYQGVKKIKYNDQSIVDKKINGYSSFKKHSSVLESEIPMVKVDLNAYAKDTFSFSMGDINIQQLNFTANNDPNIANREKFPVYDWMIRQGFRDPKDQKQEDEYNNKKDQCDSKANEANEEPLSSVASNNEISSLNNLPSGFSSNLDAGKVTTKIKEVSSFVSSMFSNFSGTMAQAGTNIRDDLFTLDYITSMFTYHTFEFEAKYKMLDKSQQTAISYNNASSYYNGLKGEWANTDVTKTFNKTLTNKLRNSSATNWSYCNEVEYIMYGKSNQESKNALNGSIYMIRFALNLPVIFSEFYNEPKLEDFALLVNAATHGIIPAGLVKVIICLGLTAYESALDMKTLKCGIPVIFIKKDKNDMFVQSWDFLKVNDNPKTDKTSVVTFSYGDYMKLFLFIKLLGSEAYNIYGRTADVVQTNMSKCVLKNDSYVLSKSQVYYTINTTVKVKPLMLDSSYVNSFMPNSSARMESWNKIEYQAIRGY